VKSSKNYLIEKEIDQSRIIIKSFGPDKPVTPNNTETNLAKNHRPE
jgi:outer membrane protein OmpA-like peptidoglycan-associated protein